MITQISTEVRMVARVNIAIGHRSTAPMKTMQATETSATPRPAENHATSATIPVKYHQGIQTRKSAIGSSTQRNTVARIQVVKA